MLHSLRLKTPGSFGLPAVSAAAENFEDRLLTIVAASD
jgi:hypothetical protein